MASFAFRGGIAHAGIRRDHRLGVPARDAIVVLLFGSTQIPKLAKSLGSARKEFEKGAKDDTREA